MRYESGGDTCLSIFRDVYETGALVFPDNAQVLEIGCAEADWMGPMLACREDLRITGIDWRHSGERPKCEIIRGDVLAYNFPPNRYDAIVGISSIEHIGLGHYENDPLDSDGDGHAMHRALRWLKPGGWVYLDVPYGPKYDVVNTSHRVYDERRLRERLVPKGFVIEGEWYSHGHQMVDKKDLAADQFQYVALLLRKVA